MHPTEQAETRRAPGQCVRCTGRPNPAEFVVGDREFVCAACRRPRDTTTSIVTREAFRVTLDPTDEQEILFRKHCGLARYVYNWALGERIGWYERNRDKPKDEREPQPSASAFSRRWTQEKPEWAGELVRNTVTYALDAVDDAYKHFFRRVKQGGEAPGFPRFKAKGRCRDSFTVQDQAFRAEPRAIKIAKIGMVRTHEYVIPTPRSDRPNPNNTRYLAGRVLRIVVSRHADRWYASIMLERERPYAPPQPGPVVGIDLGVRNVVTTSEGETFASTHMLERREKRLRKLSRSHARQENGSKNKAKRTAQIAGLHKVVVDTRAHHLHETSRTLTERGGTVVIEGFHVRELGERSGPTRGQRNASDRRRKIMQTGMGEIRRQLEYKGRWYGARIVVADDLHPSDQICSRCGHVNVHMKDRETSRFDCTQCGHADARQRNTADALARAEIVQAAE